MNCPDSRSGIYAIVNRINGKQYVGSAVNFCRRAITHKHRLREGTHYNTFLQNAWNKHGGKAFRFQRLLVCDIGSLLFYEQRAIDHFQPDYNIAETAGSVLGLKHTPKARAKMSKAKKGKKRQPHSKETKRKMSDARRMREPASPESRKRMSISAKARMSKPEEKAKLMAGRDKWIQSPEFKNRKTDWFRGRKHSPETKAKLSACRTGIPLYPEHKAKIRASKVGKPWSDARRAAQELRKKKKKGD